MLKIVIPEDTFFDEDKNEFIDIKRTELQLEHSLISLSKWESKWKKPFLGNEDKTEEMIIDYIRCMTITQNVDPTIYQVIPESEIKKVSDYIEDSMTATWFSTDDKKPKSGKKEIITSEIIYYWMLTLGVPVQFEKWHLNRLLTLIRVVNVKNAPSKNMSKKDILERNKRLNAARKAKYKTKG